MKTSVYMANAVHKTLKVLLSEHRGMFLEKKVIKIIPQRIFFDGLETCSDDSMLDAQNYLYTEYFLLPGQLNYKANKFQLI